MAEKTQAQLNAAVNADITSNGNNEITAAKLRAILLDIIDSAYNRAENEAAAGSTPSLAAVLAVGATTGANNLDIAASQAIRFLASTFNMRLEGAPTANRTIALPDASGTLAMLDASPWRLPCITALTDPTGLSSPPVGGRYLVFNPLDPAETPGGAWIGFAIGSIARYNGAGSWTQLPTLPGDQIYVLDDIGGLYFNEWAAGMQRYVRMIHGGDYADTARWTVIQEQTENGTDTVTISLTNTHHRIIKASGSAAVVTLDTTGTAIPCAQYVIEWVNSSGSSMDLGFRPGKFSNSLGVMPEGDRVSAGTKALTVFRPLDGRLTVTEHINAPPPMPS